MEQLVLFVFNYVSQGTVGKKFNIQNIKTVENILNDKWLYSSPT